jgi:hypothetical protein
MADLFNKLEAGSISETKAKALGYIAGQLRACIESGAIEDRLTQIEKVIADVKS